jgi:hypothetical protein
VVSSHALRDEMYGPPRYDERDLRAQRKNRCFCFVNARTQERKAERPNHNERTDTVRLGARAESRHDAEVNLSVNSSRNICELK